MDKNRIEGKGKIAAGRIENAAGELTGNENTKAKGAAKATEGHIQEGVGKAKDAVRKAIK